MPKVPQFELVKERGLALVAAAEHLSVMTTGLDGRVTWANEGFSRMTGYTPDEIIGHKPGEVLQGEQTSASTVEAMSQALQARTNFSGDILNYRKGGQPFWVRVTIQPLRAPTGEAIGFVSYNQDVTHFYSRMAELDTAFSDWRDSLHYARRIQTATLPDLSIVEPFVQEHFVYYQPKDVLSGDFYWTQVREGQLFFAVADATGHGVPGAMMAMLGLSMLSQILYNSSSFSTSYLLDRLHERVSRFVRGQGAYDKGVHDGMDIALVRFNPISRQLEYSGARRPMILLRHTGIEVIQPDRHSIGGDDADRQVSFQHQSFQLERGDTVYLNTDGVTDQFGGERRQKLSKKGLVQWLDEIKTMPLPLQRNELERRMHEWIGDSEQLDDILCAGLKF